MKKIILLLIVLLLFYLLVYFLGKANGFWFCREGRWVKKGFVDYPQPKKSCSEKIQVPKTKEECLKQGGKWEKWGLSPTESCNLKTIDQARICRDNNECQGLCQVGRILTESGEEIKFRKLPGRKYGQCSIWVIEPGCQEIMEKGESKMLCVD